MRRGRILSYVLCMAAFASCTEKPASIEMRPIEIAASFSGQPETRAAYRLDTPTTENPLKSEVWVSTTSHSYPGSQTPISETATSIDYHNTATFTGASKQLLNTQMYYVAEPNTTPVYLIGLYPIGWTVSADAGSASCTFSGKEDVMYAPEVSNSLSTSSNYPVLQFGHLLTWLRIYVYADYETTATSWGDINSISVASTNVVSVDTDGDKKTFTYSAESTGSLSTYLTGTDTPFKGQSQEIGLTSKEVSYVLCAPVDATDEGSGEYTLTISTSGHNPVSVPINLTASNGNEYIGNTAGHQFSVTLKFVRGDVIRTVATVTDWNSQGVSFSPVED